MAGTDIARSNNGAMQEIISNDVLLQVKQERIFLNEKTNQHEAIRGKIDSLQNVDIPKLELQRDCLQVVIDQAKGRILELQRTVTETASDIADAEFTVKPK